MWHAGSTVKERVILEDSLVGSQNIVNSQGIPEQACHTALAYTPDRLLMLAFRGWPLSLISHFWVTAARASTFIKMPLPIGF